MSAAARFSSVKSGEIFSYFSSIDASIYNKKKQHRRGHARNKNKHLEIVKHVSKSVGTSKIGENFISTLD